MLKFGKFMLVRFHFDVMLKQILLKNKSKVQKVVTFGSIYTFFGNTSYEKSQEE